jgi:hypothetical protein
MNSKVKPAKYLVNSRHEFNVSDIETARKIFEYIKSKNWSALGDLLSALSSEERESIHYAFYDLYGYDYELKIRSLVGSYRKLREYRLA